MKKAHDVVIPFGETGWLHPAIAQNVTGVAAGQVSCFTHGAGVVGERLSEQPFT